MVSLRCSESMFTGIAQCRRRRVLDIPERAHLSWTVRNFSINKQSSPCSQRAQNGGETAKLSSSMHHRPITNNCMTLTRYLICTCRFSLLITFSQLRLSKTSFLLQFNLQTYSINQQNSKVLLGHFFRHRGFSTCKHLPLPEGKHKLGSF